MTDYKFEGWLGLDKNADKGEMVWKEFTPKKWEETDIDIKITHSGICGTDLHTLRSGWVTYSPSSEHPRSNQLTVLKGATDYPQCVGHEIVGIAVRVGSQAEGNIKVGDRVGVGAQADSCLGRLQDECDECASDMEQYCNHKFVGTYDGVHLNGDKSFGGYALYNRSPSHFVFKIPEGITSAAAAPMLCAGVTTYSPLKHYGAGPGKKVGVVGLGGLGQFAILWAKALGADEIVAISRKKNKAGDALRLGADAYIATDEDKDGFKKHVRSLDIVISTISSSKVSQWRQVKTTHWHTPNSNVPSDTAERLPLPPAKGWYTCTSRTSRRWLIPSIRP
jgi:alcohol dehydrogenase (NADP+)